MPLYSTLIILSGYTFGAWTGAVLSYLASLLGAAIVFVISRAFFRQQISRWLSCTVTIKRVVRVVEKRPQLLFLIRLAPYPYNVMNCLLAASPSLTFRTYIMCTALSLFNWVCWIVPNHIVVNQLFGTASGLAMSVVSFDWSQIAYIGSPLATPWWAEANIAFGMVFFFCAYHPYLQRDVC